MALLVATPNLDGHTYRRGPVLDIQCHNSSAWVLAGPKDRIHAEELDSWNQVGPHVMG